MIPGDGWNFVRNPFYKPVSIVTIEEVDEYADLFLETGTQSRYICKAAIGYVQ